MRTFGIMLTYRLMCGNSENAQKHIGFEHFWIVLDRVRPVLDPLKTRSQSQNQ